MHLKTQEAQVFVFPSSLAAARLTTALCLPLLLAAADSWRPLGPFGGPAQAIAIDPGNPERLLAVGLDASVFRSDDAGQSWRSLTFPHEFSTLARALAVAPGPVPAYFLAIASVGPSNCGLFRSLDAGNSWDALSGMCGLQIYSLAVSQSDPKSLAAGAQDGVYLSNDSGVSWRRVSPRENADLQAVMSIAIDPRDSDTIYAGTPHLPWRTTNGGRTWYPVHRGMIDDSDVFSIEVDSRDPRHIYASACSGIYASRDSAASWTKLMGIPRSSRRTYTIRQDPAHPANVYAGTSQGLWKSIDAGLKWVALSTLVVKAIAFDPRDSRHIYFATEDAGLVTSTDGGESLHPINSGYVSRRQLNLSVGSGSLYASLPYDPGGSGIYRYSREDERWEAQRDPARGAANIRSIVAVDERDYWIATFDSIYRFSKDAPAWVKIDTPWKGRVQSLSVWPGRNAVVLAATSAGVFRTEDKARTWQLVTAKAVTVNALYTATGSGSMAIADTAGGFFLSVDRGRTWAGIQLPAEGIDLYHVAVSANGILLAATSRGLYRSDDAAASWHLQTGILGRETVRSVLFHPSQTRAFAVLRNAIYQSRDSGRTWTRLSNAGLEQCHVEALAIAPEAPGELYAATRGRGVFVLPVPDADGPPE